MEPEIPATPVKKSHKKLWITLGIIAILFILLVILSPSSSKTSASAPTTAAPKSSPATTKPKATTTTINPVAEWRATNSVIISGLASDASAISKDAPTSSAGFPKIIGDCTNLEVDSQAALSDPQIPNASIEAHWSEGLNLMVAAAKDCIAGYENVSPALVQKYITEIQGANTQIQTVASAINS